MRSESCKIRELDEEASAHQADSTSSSPCAPENTNEDPSDEVVSSRNEVHQNLLKSHGSDTKDAPRDITTQSPRIRPSQKRFTTFLIIGAFTSAVSLLGTIALLTFLWYSAKSNPFWRKIILAGWMTRLVTLCSVILRVTVSTQAGIVTSMMASLAIEETGIQLFDILELSVLRFSNSGPYNLFWLCAKRHRTSISLLLLGALSFSALGVQFSSTLLLSDVELLPITAAAVEILIPYGVKPYNSDAKFGSSLSDYSNVLKSQYWVNTAVEHYLFGEYALPVDQVDGVDDTGTVIRAIVPFAEREQRENLHSYQGPVFAFDSRVACVQPKFLTMELCEPSAKYPQEEYRSLRMCGQVAPRHAISDASINMNGSRYNCLPPFGDPFCDNSDCYEEFTLCRLGSFASGGLISVLDPTNNVSLNHSWHPFDPETHDIAPGEIEPGVWGATNGNHTWQVGLGNAYLIINGTSQPSMWNESNVTTTYHGPWAKVQVQSPSLTPIEDDGGIFLDPEIFHVTLCYDALAPGPWGLQIQDYNASLSSNIQHQEPVLRPNETFRGFDTTPAREQLGVGVSKSSFEDRGILMLSGEELLNSVADMRSKWVPPSDFEAIDLTSGNGLNTPTQPWVTSSIFNTLQLGDQINFCVSCFDAFDASSSIASPVHTSIFNRVLIDAGSPAHALQAFLTTILRSAYYIWLPLFDEKDKAMTVSFVERLAPASSRGYWIVMGLLGTHVGASATIVYLFWSKTKYSLVGSIWASFAQVTSNNQVQSILVDGTMRTDKEILTELKRNGEFRRRYRIQLAKSGNTTTLVSVDT